MHVYCVATRRPLAQHVPLFKPTFTCGWQIFVLWKSRHQKSATLLLRILSSPSPWAWAWICARMPVQGFVDENYLFQHLSKRLFSRRKAGSNISNFQLCSQGLCPISPNLHKLKSVSMFWTFQCFSLHLVAVKSQGSFDMTWQTLLPDTSSAVKLYDLDMASASTLVPIESSLLPYGYVPLSSKYLPRQTVILHTITQALPKSWGNRIHTITRALPT